MTVGEIPQEAIIAELDNDILVCWYTLLPSKTPTWWRFELVGNEYPIYTTDKDRSLKKEGLVCFVQKPTTYPEVGWYKGKAVCLFSELPAGTKFSPSFDLKANFTKSEKNSYSDYRYYLVYVDEWPDGTKPQQNSQSTLNGRPIDLLSNVSGSYWEKCEDTVVYTDVTSPQPLSDPSPCPVCKFPIKLHIGSSTCVAPHYPLLLVNPEGNVERSISLEQWNELKQQRQYADYKVEPSVTVDEHRDLGERCKICGTTYQECTNYLLHDQHPCCSTCKNIDTHNANAYRGVINKEEDLFSAPVGTYVVKFTARGKYHVVDGDKTGCGLSVTSTDLRNCEKSISTKVPNDRMCGNCFITK